MSGGSVEGEGGRRRETVGDKENEEMGKRWHSRGTNKAGLQRDEKKLKQNADSVSLIV